MRLIRLVAVVVGAAAVVAVATGIGGSGASSRKLLQECGRVEYTSGLEVVFGRFPTEAGGDALRDAVVRAGFASTNVIQGCDGFRVVLRGIEDFDSAVVLQAEAGQARFPTTVECVQGKDDAGALEAVFGHERTRSEANALVSRAAAAGFAGLQLEPDPCGGFEVMFEGLSSGAQADEFVNEAKAAGFDVVIEKS